MSDPTSDPMSGPPVLRRRDLHHLPERTFKLVGRHRLISGALAAALAVVATAILASPQGQRVWHGPSATEVALQTEKARAEDLKGQLEAAQTRLKAPRPPVIDSVQKARADALKKIFEESQQKLTSTQSQLGRLKASSGQALDAANIDKGQLKAAADKFAVAAAKTRGELKAAAQREAAAARIAKGKAKSLGGQVKGLSYKVAHPKGYTPPPVTANLTKAQVLASRRLFGLYTAQSPFSYGEFDQVENAVGQKANISGYFQDWTTGFRADAVQAAWSRGQIPLMTWESQNQVGSISNVAPAYSLHNIIDGKFDTYLHAYAKAITKNGMPLIIRFDHEMNGTWYPWSELRDRDGAHINGNSRGEYVAMWRHVHDVFAAEGANAYVIWLWSPNRINQIPAQRKPANFYPGAAYVDWIGLSGYYRPGDPAPTFTDTYGPTLPLLRAAAPGKPLFMSEIGATENHGHKAAWITSLFANLAKPANADIVGFAWFSLTVTSNGEAGTTTNDWRLNSSPSAIKAAATGLAADGYGRAS